MKCVVWALSILSFIYSASLSIPPFVNPLALVIIMLVFLMNPLKVFRHEASRFIWNYFRLENEHLNNCGKFRAVRDISVAPLDSSDQALILRMMDHPDGVHNRLTKKKHPKKTKEVDRKPLIKKESIQELALELDLAKVL